LGEKKTWSWGGGGGEGEKELSKKHGGQSFAQFVGKRGKPPLKFSSEKKKRVEVLALYRSKEGGGKKKGEYVPRGSGLQRGGGPIKGAGIRHQKGKEQLRGPAGAVSEEKGEKGGKKKKTKRGREMLCPRE